MKRKRFSEEQIIGILKEAEAGAVVSFNVAPLGGKSERPRRHANDGGGLAQVEPWLGTTLGRAVEGIL